MVVEHAWATQLAQAVLAAKGRIVVHERVPADVALAALDSTSRRGRAVPKEAAHVRAMARAGSARSRPASRCNTVRGPKFRYAWPARRAAAARFGGAELQRCRCAVPAVGARQRAGLRPVIPESSLTSDRLGEAVCRHDPPSARRRAASARTSYTPAGQARSPGEMPSPHALKPGLRTSHHNLSICSKPSDGRRRWSEHAVSGLDIGPKGRSPIRQTRREKPHVVCSCQACLASGRRSDSHTRPEVCPLGF